jgi:hypothetical protein
LDGPFTVNEITENATGNRNLRKGDAECTLILYSLADMLLSKTELRP